MFKEHMLLDMFLIYPETFGKGKVKKFKARKVIPTYTCVRMSNVYVSKKIDSSPPNTGIPLNWYTSQFVTSLIRTSIHVYHTSQFVTFCLANSYFSISFSNKNDVKHR